MTEDITEVRLKVDGDHVAASIDRLPEFTEQGKCRALQAIERAAAALRREIEREANLRFRFGGQI